MPQLSRTLLLPKYPDNNEAGALQYCKDLCTLAASLGIGRIDAKFTYHQGLLDLAPGYPIPNRFKTPYHSFLTHLDGLQTPAGSPLKFVTSTVHLTKAPMAYGDNANKGAIRLRNMGTPVNAIGRCSSTSGTILGNAADKRVFVTVNFSSEPERDRLYRLTVTTSQLARVRWYPVADSTGTWSTTNTHTGTASYDVPNPGSRTSYYVYIHNLSNSDMSWSIDSLSEVAPDGASIRASDATYYEWLGGGSYLKYGNHPRYAVAGTSDRFVEVIDAVWDEYSTHPCFEGTMAQGDEPHAMFWMAEDTSNYDNAGHELAEFEKAVAAAQYAHSGMKLCLFADPPDSTHNGISSGVYATNMDGGGFSNMLSYFDGTEPIAWVIWSGAHSAAQISQFTSKGFEVYLMVALYETDAVDRMHRWNAAIAELPPEERALIRGWYYYTEQESHATEEKLIEAIENTLDSTGESYAHSATESVSVVSRLRLSLNGVYTALWGRVARQAADVWRKVRR